MSSSLMSLGKVKAKYQVTLPDVLRRQVRVGVGDLLETKSRKRRNSNRLSHEPRGRRSSCVLRIPRPPGPVATPARLRYACAILLLLGKDLVRVAAYQAPLLAAGSMDALGLIRTRVEWCEAEGVTILCCPEAILGGLADYGGNPTRFAIAADAGRLDSVLAPLASDTVTTIVGFTELAEGGRLYNSAAVFERGSVAGWYRKLYPAIHRSVYEAGRQVPVFQVGELTLGIVICNDSNYFEPARLLAAQGATALFVPTNNGLPPARARADLVAQARNVDIARAVENSMWVIRADVAGRTGELVSYGSSGIVDPDGRVVQSARQWSEDLIVAEIDPVARVLRLAERGERPGGAARTPPSP